MRGFHFFEARVHDEEIAAAVHRLVATLREIDDDGTARQPDGTLLIRRNPPRRDGLFAQGYYHVVYAPVPVPTHGDLHALYVRMHPTLQALYRVVNGFNLFCGSLHLSGFPNGDVQGGGGQNTVSRGYRNCFELPDDMPGGLDPKTSVRFGAHAHDRGTDVWVGLDGIVRCTPRYGTGPVLFEWASIVSFIESEMRRLTCAFEECGRVVSPLDRLPAPRGVSMEA